MAQTLRVRLPHLHAGQAEVYLDPARFKVVCCGRRWGKTLMGAVLVLAAALSGKRAWWVAPTYPVAMIGWRFIEKLARSVPGISIEKAEYRITFPGGGEIQVKSADRPDSLRGQGLDLVVLDEAAAIKEDAWTEALRPALSDRKGRAVFISTPKGRGNWFYRIFKQGEADGVLWKSWQKPTADNPYIDPSEIETARTDEGMSALVFAQEYLAQFVTAEGNLFKQKTFRYYDLEGDVLTLQDPETGTIRRYDVWGGTGGQRFATVDLALSEKTHADYTVISSWFRTPESDLVLLDVQRGRWEAPEILPMLRYALERWKLNYLGIERVAYQMSMVQFARREGMPIRELSPDKDKVARAMSAVARLEGGQIWWPRVAPWLPEWEAEILDFHPQGTHEHDDQVDTLSYAVSDTWTGASQALISW